MGKVKDLGAKTAKKVTKEELQELNDIVRTANYIKNQITELTIQKHNTLSALDEAQDKLFEKQTELREKYGLVNVDLQTGELTPAQPPVNGQANS